MIGDEYSDKSWFWVLIGKLGSLLKFIARKVWDYVEHY